MVKKNTEQLILDFIDRFSPVDGVNVSYEKRKIIDTHVLIWFKLTAEIHNENLPDYDANNPVKTIVQGESYTLDKALAELTKNAMFYKKPNTTIRRVHLENHSYEGMENIVEYKTTKPDFTPPPIPPSNKIMHEGWVDKQ